MNSLEKAKLNYSISGKREEYKKAIEYITHQSSLISRINSRIETMDLFSGVIPNFQHQRTILLMCLNRITGRISNKFKDIKNFE